MRDIYQRTAILIGEENLNKLTKSHVAVFGIGGVGGYAVEALVRAGIGQITIVDFDKIDPTNINRQIIALHSTIGQYKVDVMAQRIKEINPDIQVITGKDKLNSANIQQYDFNEYDYIVDAVDDVTAKLLLIEGANQHNIPIISSMGTAKKLDPSKLEAADIHKTSVCPLARVIRKELKKRGDIALKVVYSKEEPKEAMVPNDALGSISFVPASSGLLMASQVVKDLIGGIG
ncbi:MAG: tRNA threonylcarbamoyladenosine dehydratase [Clostridia bacterium]|nr:tRNA threonylcarbamoyladenosine dehydratase [Clostridia bacterium]